MDLFCQEGANNELVPLVHDVQEWKSVDVPVCDGKGQFVLYLDRLGVLASGVVGLRHNSNQHV